MILKKIIWSQTVYLLLYTRDGVHNFQVRYTSLCDKEYQDFTLPSCPTKQIFLFLSLKIVQ